MKTHPVGAELFHADGQTDMTKLIAFFFFFLQFCECVFKKNLYLSTKPRHNILKRDYFLCSLYAMSDMKIAMLNLTIHSYCALLVNNTVF